MVLISTLGSGRHSLEHPSGNLAAAAVESSMNGQTPSKEDAAGKKGRIMTENNNNHKNNDKAGIREACETVQAILEQVTWNDSPPINEQVVSPGGGTGASETIASSSSDVRRAWSPRKKPSNKGQEHHPVKYVTQRYSRQRHIIPNKESGMTTTTTSTPPSSCSQDSSSPHNAASVASTLSHTTGGDSLFQQQQSQQDVTNTAAAATTTTTAVALWTTQYRHCQTQSETRLGHVALATLCARTLESIEATTDTDLPEETIYPQQSESHHRYHSSTRQLEPPSSSSMHNNNNNNKDHHGLVLADSLSSDESGVDAPLNDDDHHNKQQHPNKSPSSFRRWPLKSPLSPTTSNVFFSSKENKGRSSTPTTPAERARRRGSAQQDHQDLRQKSSKDVDGPNLSQLAIEAQDVFSPQRMPPTPIVSTKHHKFSSPTVQPADSGDSTEAVYVEVDEDYIKDHVASTPTYSEERGTVKDLHYHNTAGATDHRGNSPSMTIQTSASTVAPPQQRLQMYGSEYARFLSLTALGPDTKRHGKRTTSSSINKRQLRSLNCSSHHRLPGHRSLNIEDASHATLTGAITDIVMTHGSQLPPKGYYRISQTGNGDEFTALNTSSSNKSSQVYINVKKESNWDRAAQRPCVTALAVIFPDRQEFVPPGFCIVRHYRGPEEDHGRKEEGSSSMAANLNFASSGGERVFLCYRRSREGNPITGILPLQPSHNETIPEGYTVIERTPRNHVADLNGQAGTPVFLGFRQRLASLEPLRPLPLVLSVHHASPFESLEDTTLQTRLPHQQRGRSTKKRLLRAYYCTGGTVVPSEVGKFHILDRSTHSMLSPSSIANRLTMIETARRRACTNVASPTRSTQGVQYAASSDLVDTSHTDRLSMGSDHGSLPLDPPESGSNMDDSNHSFGVGYLRSSSSRRSLSGDSSNPEEGRVIIHSLSGLSASHNSGRGDDGSQGSVSSSRLSLTAANVQTLFSQNDQELQECLDALHFIPAVGVAGPHRVGDTGYDVLEDDDVDRVIYLQARIASLTPILTSCYTHHGGSALIAIEGLNRLLTCTDFFAPDVTDSDDEHDRAGSRLTLLDLAVQSVCDVATSSSREAYFGACVEFVQNAVRFARGRLCTRTIGYVLRFYLFVFYFGASVPTLNKHPVWTPCMEEQKDAHGTRSVVAREDVPLLYEKHEDGPRSVGSQLYRPGGAPQAATLALKELVLLTLARLGKIRLENNKKKEGAAQSSSGNFIDAIVSSLIDNSVHRVDVANYTQLALHQIHRSGGSELFWYDMMNSCGSGLFGNIQGMSADSKDLYVMSFSLLANVVKVSSGRIRLVPKTLEPVPRDVSSKLLSLELLEYFLVRWREEVSPSEIRMRAALSGPRVDRAEAIDTMVFSIRRLVVPCLLSNTLPGLEDARIFRRLMRIVSELWLSPIYRQRMKMELGVLMSHFALGMLQLGPQLLSLQQLSETEPANNDSVLRGVKAPLIAQQIDLLFEVNRWFDADSLDLVQLFLNFDTQISLHDNGQGQLLPGSLFKMTQQLCGGICTLAEQAGDVLCEQIRSSQMSNGVPPPSPKGSLPTMSGDDRSNQRQMIYMREGARHLQTAAFDAITEIVRCLAGSAAMAAGIPFRKITKTRVPTDNSSDASVISMNWSDDLSDGNRSVGKRRSFGMLEGNDHILQYWRSSVAAERHKSPARPLTTERLKEATVVTRNPHKGSAKTWTKGRRDSKVLKTEDTLEVALGIAKRKSLRKAIDYLIACDFLAPSPRDIAAFLRAHSARLDAAAVGYYLGEGGTDGADAEYWNLIRFSFVRATSFVGMSVDQGLRHFLTSCGFRLPGEAQRVDRLISTFAQCFWEDNAGDRSRCPFSDQDTIYIVSFSIIMLNTDLHKAQPASNSRKQRKKMTKSDFINNLRGVDGNEELSRDYLSAVYDSIEAHPIELFDEPAPSGLPGDEIALLKSMLKNAKTSEELLRGLSVHEHKMYTVEDFARSLGYDSHIRAALQDISRTAFASTWHHIHGLVHTALDTAHTDPRGMVASLDLLKYSLYVSICLGMTMERTAFTVQLARFKTFAERRGDWRYSHEQQGFKLEEWYRRLAEACHEAENESKLSALAQVKDIIEDLHATLEIDVKVKHEMTRVVRKIRDGEFLLNDPTRSFLREGQLTKKGTRLGRTSKCHLFLFSDVLIYAKETSAGDGHYKIHEELPLHLLKVTDWFPKQQTKTAFQIHHPRKTFIVYAASLEERCSWVKDIREAVAEEVNRLAHLEGARVAAVELER